MSTIDRNLLSPSKSVLAAFGSSAVMSGGARLVVARHHRSLLGQQWSMRLAGGVPVVLVVAFVGASLATDPRLNVLVVFAAGGGRSLLLETWLVAQQVAGHHRGWLRGRAGAIGIGGLLALLPVHGAWAAAGVSVSPATAAAGGTVTISGNAPTDACSPSAAVQLTSTATLFPPNGFGPQASRDAVGNFTSEYAIPVSTPPGTYRIGVRCGGGTVGVTASLSVVRASAASVSAVPASVMAGAATVFSGLVPADDCSAGAQVQLTATAGLFPPDGLGPRASRDANGAFAVSYTVPAAAPPGEYRVGIRCAGGVVGAAATVRVTQATPTTGLAPATTVAPPASTVPSGAASTSVPPTESALPRGGKPDSSINAAWGIAVGALALIAAALAVPLARRRATK